ncbi:MAG: rod shape-determining protein MreD [Planctomycetaceae bacterium]
MFHLVFALLMYLACVAQAGLRTDVAFGPVAPDWLGLMLVMALLTFDQKAALVWAAVVGLLADCLTAEALGIGMTCAVVIACVAQRLGLPGRNDSLLSVGMIAFLVVFALGLTSSTARLFVADVQVDAVRHVLVVTGTAAYSAVLAVALRLLWRAARQTGRGIIHMRSAEFGMRNDRS